ncbi:hypothetical protein [Planctobacterium marinum]|uniref:hypothetical protein n=1 Tax=Planctobacterium marinum TaxID=1631968 RepID=UPI001E53E641|nr:hypothetical protein [Planctobacterium marinum]MCC2603777.1 hypothetical protein [Planctobacterium marinum]
MRAIRDDSSINARHRDAVIDGRRCSDGDVYVVARQGLRGILKGVTSQPGHLKA